eukprot:CAMPEP_0181296974 /NCGR_PEP_ID=MMETSP1101-20121128/4987_1 /TAXON_ID=46948 /ORGANISM="Rhodomonas abbreviata, Strain Caron Lab Isolate" /LENGTH=654 /DNA_ID=CAMNT_0023401869 /DNA_START=232 /DNA_END=2193 /DNA_ORIENTATION=+
MQNQGGECRDRPTSADVADEEHVTVPAASCPAAAFVDLLLSSQHSDVLQQGEASSSSGQPQQRPKRTVAQSIGALRAKVLALRAFQGLVKTIQSKGLSPRGADAECRGTPLSSDGGMPWQLSLPTMEAFTGGGDLEGDNFSEADLAMLRDATAKLELSIRAASSDGLPFKPPEDIDSVLKRRDDAGAAVFSRIPSIETPWNLPDLAVIFRPPPKLIEMMAIGVRPGMWIKIAPEVAPNSKSKNKWSLLKSVVNSGIAFKLCAKQAHSASKEEQIEKREQVQMEVDNFKSFLLSITRAWEELMQEDEHEGVSRCSSGTGVYDGSAPGPVPERSSFLVKAIATGICHIFPGMSIESQVLETDLLAQHCPSPWKDEKTGWEIVEVNAGQTQSVTAKGKKARHMHHYLSMSVRGTGPQSAHNIALKIWATGKTQTCGCKDRDMLEAANQCVANVIRYVYDNCTRNIFRPRWQEQAAQHLGQVGVLSAPLVGSWDLRLARQGMKMHMSNLCDFLSGEEFADRVYKVTHVPTNGNSARFNNLSLYVRKECLKRWPSSDADQTSVYVNVYEAGKCCVLAAPNQEVAEELADIVSDMLWTALNQDDIRLQGPVDEGGGKRKKAKKNRDDAGGAGEGPASGPPSGSASASAHTAQAAHGAGGH